MLKLCYKLKRFLNIPKKENKTSSELQELYKIIDDMLESTGGSSKELYNYYYEHKCLNKKEL